MRTPLIIACLTLIAACAAPSSGLRPTLAEASRADGFLSFTSVTSLFSAVAPDWTEAAEAADRRCRSWGREPRATLAGWQETCGTYDRYGRCTTTRVTRYYACT